MPKVALVEVFAAPQGEGYNAGRSAVFVRLAGCPLACEFAPGVVCDTPYQQANMKVSRDELFKDILPPLVFATAGAHPMLIFTGGEPTACPQFDELMRRAHHDLSGVYLAVETNGTRYRKGLRFADWISVSPKEDIPQTSQAPHHNHNPHSPDLDPDVCRLMLLTSAGGGEYRYVIAADTQHPVYYSARRHYVSPAVQSDGSGQEWKTGFPGFAPGAVSRCLEIIKNDPRWRISIQTHKILGVR